MRAGRTRYHDGRVGVSELGFYVSCATLVPVQLGGSLVYFSFVSNLMVVFFLLVLFPPVGFLWWERLVSLAFT